MSDLLDLETITPEALLAKVAALRKDGYRLVQIGATRLSEGVELTYSFDLQDQARHLRIQLLSANPAVPSITSVYWAAFLYENELHDLFHVQVDGIAVDFHGTLYKTAIQFPFGSTRIVQGKPVPADTAPGASAAQASSPRTVPAADIPKQPVNSRN
jgi:ech hydrogenase subunit D